MAERPRQHVLETESKKAFESVIPSEWNINYQHSDYGLDAKVQIFENGKSTPYFFFVQLKSTEEVKSKKIISYPFSNERLKEYKEYPLPVLLVLFDSKRKKLFCKWTHHFFDELVIKEKNELSHEGKTKVRFEQEIDENFIDCLFEEVKDYYFLTGKVHEHTEEIRIRLNLNFEEELVLDIENQFKNWLRNNEELAFVKIGRFDNPNLLIRGILESNVIEIRSRCRGNTFPFLEDLYDENFLQLFTSALKIILADYLAISGRRQTALNVITHFLVNNCPINSTAEFFFHFQPWISEYFFEKRDLEVFEVADNLLKTGNSSLADNLAFASQILGSSVFREKKYHEFCIKSFELAVNNKNKGIAAYNLASGFRSFDLFKKAVIYYCKAAKFAPKYLEKSYWWAEIAGCFFLLGKFLWAEYCYKKAVELKEERIPARYLLGDTLLYQGRFEDASRELAVYLEETEKPVAGAILKKWLSDFLLVNFGDTKRNILKSDELNEEAINSEQSEDKMNLFYEAIKLDPLSGVAWFNYRVCERALLNQTNFSSWLASILTNPDDITSWANFIVLRLIEFSKSDENTNFILLAVISEGYKDKIKLEDTIRNNIPEEMITEVLEFLENLSKKANELFYQDPSFVMRPF